MYTGTLIEELIEMVEMIERRIKSEEPDAAASR